MLYIQYTYKRKRDGYSLLVVLISAVHKSIGIEIEFQLSQNISIYFDLITFNCNAHLIEKFKTNQQNSC